MLNRLLGIFLLFGTLSISTACSDDAGTQPDQGAAKDSGSSLDTRQDFNLPAACELACYTKAPYLCVTDSFTKKCVECTKDEHCAQNPGALGNTCDTQYKICKCKKDGDCSGKTHGAKCVASLSLICGCTTDGDCSPPRLCLGALFGARVCAVPCAADTDCKSAETPRCDTKTGKCVACSKDTDCTSTTKPYCSNTLGTCVACDEDAHCAGTATPICDTTRGVCAECKDDSGCTSGKGWGNKCITNSQGLKQCRCAASGDCASNVNGPTCSTKEGKCSCASAADCKSIPTNTSCSLPYLDAAYKHCRKPCAVNTDCGVGLKCHKTTFDCVECLSSKDCTSSLYNICDTTLSRCVACLKDTDCSGTASPYCDAAAGKCVVCKTNTDCAKSPDGALCDKGACTCKVDQDCKTTYPWGAKCLSISTTNSKRCGCSSHNDCASNPNGPRCYTLHNKCSCATATECTVTPYKNCENPYPNAKYKHCQKPCASDLDCAAHTHKRCHKTSGKCVACTDSSHCATQEWAKLCNLAKYNCVECIKTTDCAATSLGNKCANNLCVCTADTDCASNLNGHLCNLISNACHCLKDTDCPTGKTCAASNLGVKLCK